MRDKTEVLPKRIPAVLAAGDWQGMSDGELSDDMHQDEYCCRLLGSSGEIAAQVGFLEGKGHTVYGPQDPSLLTYDKFEAALKDIWQAKALGWCNYLTHYLRFRICTQEELSAALPAS